MGAVSFGVVGVRGVGRTHLEGIKETDAARVVAISDIDRAVGKQVSEEYGVDYYHDYGAMLEREDLDAVCICTPNFLHAPMALEALNRGKHVLLEKPMATTVGGADQLIDTAESQNVKLGVVYQYRTKPVNIKMKELIEGGEIGRIYRAVMELCEVRTQAYYKRGEWRGKWRDAGGGVLITQAIHHIDLLQWFVGKPVELWGRIGRIGHEIEVEDVASAFVSFEDGVHAVFQASNLEGPRTGRIEVCGDQGKLIQDDGIRFARLEKSISDFVKTSDNAWAQPEFRWMDVPHEVGDDGHRIVIEDFADAILQDRDPMVTGEEGRTSLEIVNGIILSHFRGKPVTFPIDRHEYSELMQRLSSKKYTL